MLCHRWSREAVKKWEGELCSQIKYFLVCNILSVHILTHQIVSENYSELIRKRLVDLLVLEIRLERVWALCLGIGNRFDSCCS